MQTRQDPQGFPQLYPDEMVDPSLPTRPIGLAPGYAGAPPFITTPQPGSPSTAARLTDIMPQISAQSADPSLTMPQPKGRLGGFFQKSQNFLGDNPLALALLGGLATAGVSKAYGNSPTAAANTLGLVRTFAGGMQDKREQDVQRIERSRKYAKETEQDAKRNYLKSLVDRGPQEGQTADMFKRELYSSALDTGLDPRVYGLSMDDLLEARMTAQEQIDAMKSGGLQGASWDAKGRITYAQRESPDAPKVSATTIRSMAAAQGVTIPEGVDDAQIEALGTNAISGFRPPKPDVPEALPDNSSDLLVLRTNPQMAMSLAKEGFGIEDMSKLSRGQMAAIAAAISKSQPGQGNGPIDPLKWIQGVK